MINIPITLQSDENGYFDRECPNENCLYQFKIKLKDWEEKVSDEEVHCPMCGHVDTSEKWWTQDQLEQMQEIAASYAMNYIQTELDKSFKSLEKSTRHNKFIKITYKPGKRVSFINNPVGQMPEWEQEISCEKCGTTYSVIGSAYFCPCCGYNSASSSFSESLDTIQKMLDSVEQMKALFGEKYDADKADTMCRSMIEGSLGDCVSAFQKFAEQRYIEITGNKARVNDFQIIDKGCKLFKDSLGYGYEKWLSVNELQTLNIYFQKRHLFEHNNGMVDQQYLSKTGDANYSLGQRLIIRKSEIEEVLRILKKLGDGILSVKPIQEA